MIISAVIGYLKFCDKVVIQNLVVTGEDEGLFFGENLKEWVG
jgi:hypothetical protein